MLILRLSPCARYPIGTSRSFPSAEDLVSELSRQQKSLRNGDLLDGSVETGNRRLRLLISRDGISLPAADGSWAHAQPGDALLRRLAELAEVRLA